MLLVIDVGNTNTVLGLFEGHRLVESWRLTTSANRTADENGILVQSLFQMASVQPDQVDGCIISCVVPPLLPMNVAMVERFFGIKALVVGPGIKTGMPILYENPREVGADRIVNAVAAYESFKQACIVVDFGTATTFDAISSAGEYMGGSICPGVVVSSEALFKRASRLPRVEIVAPQRVIGRNTVASMQSGIVYGYLGLVDGLVKRIRDEYQEPMRVTATGGLARYFATLSESIESYDDDLTLTGLRLLYERNHVPH